MDFRFYKVEENLNNNIHSLVLSEEKRVFKSRRLDNSIYKLKKKPQQQFFDLRYFLSERVEEGKNNKQDRYFYNEFTIKINFLLPNENDINIQLCKAYFNENGFDKYFLTDECFLEDLISLYEKNFYKIVITEILRFLTPQDIDSDTDDGEQEEITPPIIKTFKEDKCIICLENKPNILY